MHKPLGFSNSTVRHDLVIGWFLNPYEVGLSVSIMKARAVTPPFLPGEMARAARRLPVGNTARLSLNNQQI
jgi:hypothetical protein